ncbi:MAG: aldo/keto reductase [Lachnospiraceae bacterium]|nr:aldo/keto reductase [Lachnospiraceae bacterium]
MRYKKLYGTSEEISVMGLGGWAVGGQNYGPTEDSETIRAIHAALDMGVNFIDTAPDYGQKNSEALIGKAIKDRRDKVFLTTKLDRGGGYDYAMEQIDKSLERLGVDYVDAYYLHWPDTRVPIEESMSAFRDLQKAGKIRYVGVSNFDIALLEEAQKTVKIQLMQPPFSLVDQRQRERLEWCESHGINIVTYGSLGGGILTGRYRTLPEFDEKDPRITFYDFFKEPKFSKCMELLAVLDKIAADHKVPVSQVAINWVSQQSFVTTSLMGVTKVPHAKENAAAFDWELSPEELGAIDDEYERVGLGRMGWQKSVIQDETAEHGIRVKWIPYGDETERK